MTESQKLKKAVAILREAGYTVEPPKPSVRICQNCEQPAIWVMHTQFAGCGFFCQDHAELQPGFESPPQEIDEVWVLLVDEYKRATKLLLGQLIGHSFATSEEMKRELIRQILNLGLARNALPLSGFETKAMQIGREQGWIEEQAGKYVAKPPSDPEYIAKYAPEW